jgi:hypothetical protein
VAIRRRLAAWRRRNGLKILNCIEITVMPKIRVTLTTAEECETASLGTDEFTKGWWYHGTGTGTARAILDGRKAVYSPLWLTKNPDGASQRHGQTVIRCTVLLQTSQPPGPTDDRYVRKEANEGLDQPFCWIGVYEGSVFFDRDFMDIRNDAGAGEMAVPTVGEELQRIQEKRSNE